MTINKHWPKLALALAALVMLGLGTWLIVDYLNSIPPDPNEADSSEVVAYFFSDHFDGLTDPQQHQYVQAMVKRYGSMSDKQRQAVEEAVKSREESDPDSTRDRMVEMWKNYAVAEAKRYVNVPSDQRKAWLEARIAGWRSMFANGHDHDREADQRRRERRRERQNRPLTPQRQKKVVGFMKDQVMPRTSVKERALVSLLARDIGQQLGPNGSSR